MTTNGTERKSGTIVRVMLTKGFGFVRAASGDEYFLHASDLKNCPWDAARIHEGTTVTFVPAKTPKGERATDVVVVG